MFQTLTKFGTKAIDIPVYNAMNCYLVNYFRCEIFL